MGLRSADSVLLPPASEVRAGPEGAPQDLSCCCLSPMLDLLTFVPALFSRFRKDSRVLSLASPSDPWKGTGDHPFKTLIFCISDRNRFLKTN